MPLVKTDSNASKDVNSRQQSYDFEELIKQLNDSEALVRRWAAQDLIPFPQASKALVERLQIEENFSVREVILTSLTRIADTVAVTQLVQWLRNEDAQKRNEAIEALQSMPEKVALMMEELLADKDADVRIMVVSILESLNHEKVEEWLIRIIDHDPELNVCGAALDLLGEVGTSLAYSSLQNIKVRFAEEPYIQFAADLALKRLEKA